MDPNRRDSQRISILGSLHGEVMVYQPMEVTEVGEGGVTVETSFPMHLDSLHELRLTLAGSPIVVKGRVAHSQIADVNQDVVTYRSGLEFVEVPPRIMTALADYLATTRSDRRGA